ncbi:unnamed protein product [Anisakis simplex]|uniref:Uncharacterized protein n=1 Tax=Anisakis simplex TaxID=6269 RepID=A0A3P6PCJ6_ANISI|nr:unnamed protein product [Anisakis simplex]
MISGYPNSFQSAFCSTPFCPAPDDGTNQTVSSCSVRRVEYPTALPPSTNNGTNIGITSQHRSLTTPQTQLFPTSEFGQAQLTTLKPSNVFENDSSTAAAQISLNYDTSTDYKNLLTLSDYSTTMHVTPTNISATAAGFNLISEVTNSLLT